MQSNGAWLRVKLVHSEGRRESTPPRKNQAPAFSEARSYTARGVGAQVIAEYERISREPIEMAGSSMELESPAESKI
jgi:hypothetical protein